MELPAVFEKFRETVERFVQRLEREKLPQAKPAADFLVILDTFFAGLEKEKDRNALGMLRDFQGNLLADFPEKIQTLKNTLDAAPVTPRRYPGRAAETFYRINREIPPADCAEKGNL